MDFQSVGSWFESNILLNWSISSYGRATKMHSVNYKELKNANSITFCLEEPGVGGANPSSLAI